KRKAALQTQSPIPISVLNKGIEHAQAVNLKISQAISRMRDELNRSPVDGAALKRVFTEADADEDLTKYTPQAPTRDLSDSEWTQFLTNTIDHLQTAERVNQRAVDSLRKELAKSTATGSLVIKTLVKNKGNTTGGFYDGALLTFDVGDPV